MSRVPFPDDSYVTLIGRVAYAISYVEWLLLGDLSRLPDLPEQLTVGSLAGKPTGRIASEVDAHLPAVPDPEVRRFLSVSAQALHDLAPLRNHILHARPATIDGAQRLNRWRLLPDGSGEAFQIDEAFLQSVLDRADEAITDIYRVRLPF